jgi:DNA-binding transcriptional ArsR family regulator
VARSQLSALGAVLADDTRAEILTLLMDGRAHTGSELARHVGVVPSTASEHLSRLLDAGLVGVEPQGRHRYFRLASRDVAELLETLGATPALTAAPRPAAPAALAFARTCYDHFAGELAVRLYDHLVAQAHLHDADEGLALTPSGLRLFDSIGIDIEAIKSSQRCSVRRCLDWTERRHHLAGAAGAALLDALLANRWVTQGSQARSLRVTNAGRKALTTIFASPQPDLTPSLRVQRGDAEVKGKTLEASDEGDDTYGVAIKPYGEETNRPSGSTSSRSSPVSPTATRPRERRLALHTRGRDPRPGRR